jgi:coatomer subunit beta
MEHRHAYVRKNAVFTVLSIYKNHEHLIPDAPELLLTFLAAESDATCKRNAFVSLCTIAQPRAVEYLLSILDTVPSLDELFQLAIIDLVRREARTSPSDGPHRAKWIRTIFELLTATSGTVKYEAATSLTSLTQNPAAVKAAASCFVDLCVKESDNNVKLIVLDRLDALREKHERVLDPLVTDVLRVLGSNDMAVKRKTMRIALEMVSSRNVEDVVSILKKQLANTVEESQYEKNLEYRQLRSRRLGRSRPYGIHRRLWQLVRRRRHRLCPRGRSAIPQASKLHHREASRHPRQRQVGQGLPRRALDRRRVLHGDGG